MVKCSRCCLHCSMKMVNLVVILFGVVIIVYSLWLLKRWDEGIREKCSRSTIPKPWFIYTSLGEGIVVCLSMLSGHMVACRISSCTLLTYVASVCSLLCLQTVAFISIFYKIDWNEKISKYIDVQDEIFGNFLRLNFTVSRVLLIVILAAQINAVIVAFILWATGPEPRSSHCRISDLPELKQSFLVLPDSPVQLSGGSSIGRNFEA
ncbi:tetraspanin-19-like [Macadamia integrifolia]|uniref:tetraspanin-19-like n=1 Tax=Macadamia integrifolia TaxID=60698 RepID=UPI001C4ED69B|nr:tetraspanin-19-like [Macadamia integrifolia]XP_042488325.1 tetraspanin-19-like [Macadamia integrifolia]